MTPLQGVQSAGQAFFCLIKAIAPELQETGDSMGNGPWNAERAQLLMEVQRLQAHCLSRLDSLPLFQSSGSGDGLLMRYRADLVMALMRLQALEALILRDMEVSQS